MPKRDVEKRKEYNKQYYLKNKDKNKCEHSRQKYTCKECCGSGVCEHNRIKSVCKECGGNSVCEHKRVRSQCKECEGGSFCEHNRVKSRCKECGGGHICEHSRRRSECKECGGGHICEHNRIRSICKECGGGHICEHNRIRSICKECGGGHICDHSRRRNQCKECSFMHCLVNLQRNNVRRVIKLCNIEKTKPSIEYLGCDIDYFKNYIESKFTEGMNWDNIHLDHIKPVSAFDLDDYDEFLNCCSYYNFQPLLAQDNLIKSRKWNKEDELFYNANIKNQEYKYIYIPK